MAQEYGGQCGWSQLYCSGVLIIGVMVFINVVLVGFLLWIDVKAARNQHNLTWHKDYFKKIKSWILLIAVVMNFV